MSRPTLGRLRNLDVSEFWGKDGVAFTEWLTQDENLALLAETIGLDLEAAAPDGQASLAPEDVLCRDTVSDQWVLVTTQFSKTGHEHLGRVLSQGAGINAAVIVWVAQNFAEEHRAALDWLNEITDIRFNCFGLEIELWQIGDSPAAPKFNIVSKPNDWTKSLTGTTGRLRASGAAATKQLLQLEYWTFFRERMLSEAEAIRPPKAYPRAWMSFAAGRSNFRLLATISATKKTLSVSLVMDGPDAKPHYHLLQRDRAGIEREFGTPLEWREQPRKKESVVLLETPSDPADRAAWAQQHGWLLEWLERFRAIFAPRIQALDADEFEREPPAGIR
ncbi:MAG: DUF4268 domain-containing protein [Proteobacteria bacterium]|nr:DUF4268 domain-containing protein [Pseudomonadota bacterium]